MNILVLAHNAEGFYRPRRELMQALKQCGHKVVVSVPRGNCYDKISAIVDEVVDTPIERRGKNPFKDLRLWYFYRRLMKVVKPDCVLSYAIKPNLYGGMAAQTCNIPYMPNITGLGTAFDKAGPVRALIVRMYRKIAGGAQCAFLQNKANQEELESFGIHWKRPVLISTGRFALKNVSFLTSLLSYFTSISGSMLSTVNASSNLGASFPEKSLYSIVHV